MLGISLLQYVHRQAKAAWSDLSMEQLLEELQQIQQLVVFFSRRGQKGSPFSGLPMFYRSKLSARRALAKALKLDELQNYHRG